MCIYIASQRIGFCAGANPDDIVCNLQELQQSCTYGGKEAT